MSKEVHPTRGITLVCDGDNVTCHDRYRRIYLNPINSVNLSIPEREAQLERIAKGLGWKFLDGGHHLCPVCNRLKINVR